MFRSLNIDFPISKRLQNGIETLLDNLNFDHGDNADALRKDIENILNSENDMLTDAQIKLLWEYYCGGGVDASDTRKMHPTMEKTKGLFQYLQKYDFPEYVIDSAREFLVNKEIFLLSGTKEWLTNSYENLYCSLKAQWVNGRISENTFWELVNRLKEDL